jgi:acyl carrier protein
MQSEIESTVRDFIIREFLPGEDPQALTRSTPLVTGGILDSIATLKLVSFLEEQFQVELAPHETDADHLDTISLIATLVESKRPVA